MQATDLPSIIQGGMGVAVSGWRLARAVSMQHQVGVVSGTGLDLVMVRRLQEGDSGGHVRRALSTFPQPDVARRILDRYYIPGGKAPGEPYRTKPMPNHRMGRHVTELVVASNYVEVFLAKEGHDGIVGVNYLHKIQPPLMASIYGAMLAGVDLVIVGAGIPLSIPGIIDRLYRHQCASMPLDVRSDTRSHSHTIEFDPATLFDSTVCRTPLRRPLFLPIVSSQTLARILVRKCGNGIDGLIVEMPSAGGHNAPPRNKTGRGSYEEPVYSPKDWADPKDIRSLGLPFWLAGSYGSPDKLNEALLAGAAGVQIGTLFAFSQESGISDALKERALDMIVRDRTKVRTDGRASPTGYPFKVLPLSGTISDADVYAARERRCDLGYLREAFEREDGSIGWRCPADDPATYVRDGGTYEETQGRKCLCNALLANIGLGQIRDGAPDEQPLLTAGDDLEPLRLMLGHDRQYSAHEVVDFMLAHA